MERRATACCERGAGCARPGDLVSDNFDDRQRREQEERRVINRALHDEVSADADATNRLRQVIEANQRATERQTRVMLRLTRVMTFLAVVTTIPAVVEIWRLGRQVWPFVNSWLWSIRS